jgi:hypothetical protein
VRGCQTEGGKALASRPRNITAASSRKLRHCCTICGPTAISRSGLPIRCRRAPPYSAQSPRHPRHRGSTRALSTPIWGPRSLAARKPRRSKWLKRSVNGPDTEAQDQPLQIITFGLQWPDRKSRKSIQSPRREVAVTYGIRKSLSRRDLLTGRHTYIRRQPCIAGGEQTQS